MKNRYVSYAVMGLGGLALFCVAFILFAVFSGTPLHEVAVIKHFVAAPVVAESAPELAARVPEPTGPRSTGIETVQANAGVLGAFTLPSPFTSSELRNLQNDLKGKRLDVQTELQRLRQRGLELDEREAALKARYDELTEFRTRLENFEEELRLREEEIDRDEKAAAAREGQSWKELAKVFADGDAEELAQRLAASPPEDAARILLNMESDRAGELMRALPLNAYQDVAAAYQKLVREGEK